MSVTLTKAAWDHAPTVVGYRKLALRRLGWVLSLGGPPMTAMACTGFIPYAGLVFALTAVLAAPSSPGWSSPTSVGVASPRYCRRTPGTSSRAGTSAE